MHPLPARRATSAKPLRLGLVGRGRWGANIERTLLSLGDVRLTIIGRGDASPSDLDGVLVATPGPTHAEVALPYIERGIATFIEKPMATSSDDAERICEAARRSGAAVFVGHIYLYNPAFRELIRLLPELGAVREVLCEAGSGNIRPDTSLFWEWLPHHLAMANQVFGTAPTQVEAWHLAQPPAPAVAVCRAFFGGTPLVSTLNAALPVKRRQVTVTCDQGTLFFDDMADRKLVVCDRDGRSSYPPYSDTPPLTCELQEFVDMVRRGGAGLGGAEDGAAIVRVIAAVEQSALRDGAAVRL